MDQFILGGDREVDMKAKFVLNAMMATILIAVVVIGCSADKDRPVAPISLQRPATLQLDYVGDWNCVTPARWDSIKSLIRDGGGRFIVYTRPIDADSVYTPPNSADWLARAGKVCETKQALVAFGDQVMLGGDNLRSHGDRIVSAACAVTGMSQSYLLAKMYSIPVGHALMADKDYAEECGLPIAPDSFYVRRGARR